MCRVKSKLTFEVEFPILNLIKHRWKPDEQN